MIIFAAQRTQMSSFVERKGTSFVLSHGLGHSDVPYKL